MTTGVDEGIAVAVNWISTQIGQWSNRLFGFDGSGDAAFAPLSIADEIAFGVAEANRSM